MTKFELVESRLEELKKDYKNISPKKLEEKYEASYSTIQRVLKKHGFIKGKPEQIKYSYVREHEDEFIKDWVEGVLTPVELEEKYKCPYTTLYSRSNELNIYRKNKIDNISHYDLIYDWLRNDCTNEFLCDKYNISEGTLHKILHLHDIKISYDRHRKYFFNEKYFDVIDDEHKAYWLGFIYSDGCHNEERYSLSITLQERDIDLLDQFYKDIECNKNVRKQYNKDYERFYASVCVQHPNLSETLLKQGVPSNKSFKIKFPNDEIVPVHLKRHFIRGYLDGDGCIQVPKNKSKMSWSIIGNYDCMNEMRKFIETNILNYQINICKHQNVYQIGKGGRFVTQIFLDWLYKDATIYLQRKYDKYLEIVKYNKEKENEKNRDDEENCEST